MGQAARPVPPAALALLSVSVWTASVFQLFVFPLFVACCFVFFFYFGRLVVKYKEISSCLSAAYLVGVCMSVCVWNGAIAHYANYLHEFSILVKRFGALLGHKGEKLGISRNMIKMTFDGDDERNLNPAQIDLSEAN